MSSGVEFEEDKIQYGIPGRKSDVRGPIYGGYGKPGFAQPPSRMVRWLISHGFAGSPFGANVVLFAIVVVNIIITILVIKYLM